MLNLKNILFSKLQKFLPAIILILTLITFIGLTNAVLNQKTLWLDNSIIQFTIGLRAPFWTKIMIAISLYGDKIALALAALLVIFTAYKKRFRQSGTLLFTIAIPLLFTYFFKNIIQRPRPNILYRLVTESGFSFPSQHATVAFTIYPILAIWLWHNTTINKILKVCLIFGLGLLAIIIGISRLYLGVHYFSDILAGVVIGISMAWLYYTLQSSNNIINASYVKY